MLISVNGIPSRSRWRLVASHALQPGLAYTRPSISARPPSVPVRPGAVVLILSNDGFRQRDSQLFAGVRNADEHISEFAGDADRLTQLHGAIGAVELRRIENHLRTVVVIAVAAVRVFVADLTWVVV